MAQKRRSENTRKRTEGRGALSGQGQRTRQENVIRHDAAFQNRSTVQRETASQERRAAQKSTQGKRRRKKRRRMKRRTAKFLLVLGTVLLLAAAAAGLLIYICRLQTIDVTGNTYTSSATITAWVDQDKFCSNSLYAFWKLNQDDIELPSSVESVEVVLKAPDRIQIKVTEKTFSGRIDFNGGYLYFDQDGIASLESTEVIEGVPYIEGMEISEEDVVLGEMLPVSDEEVFTEIDDVMALLTQYELTADKISCSGDELTVYFGNIRAQLGSAGFDLKIAQLPSILSKLNESYADQTGVLHLENYSADNTSVRFVPDTAEDTTEETTEGTTEDTTAEDTTTEDITTE